MLFMVPLPERELRLEMVEPVCLLVFVLSSPLVTSWDIEPSSVSKEIDTCFYPNSDNVSTLL